MSKVSLVCSGLTAIVSLLSMPAMASAQATSGSMTGRVVDASGAALAGATITVTSDRTGLSRAGTTGADGQYLVSTLPPDVYSIGAAAPGFRTGRRSGVTLVVDQTLRIDFTLGVGDFSDVKSNRSV